MLLSKVLLEKAKDGMTCPVCGHASEPRDNAVKIDALHYKVVIRCDSCGSDIQKSFKLSGVSVLKQRFDNVVVKVGDIVKFRNGVTELIVKDSSKDKVAICYPNDSRFEARWVRRERLIFVRGG